MTSLVQAPGWHALSLVAQLQLAESESPARVGRHRKTAGRHRRWDAPRWRRALHYLDRLDRYVLGWAGGLT